jgi:hypothetical protein
MACRINDPATLAAVRKLAAERGISPTAAAREAVANELERCERDEPQVGEKSGAA